MNNNRFGVIGWSVVAMLFGAMATFALFEGGNALVALVSKPGSVFYYQAPATTLLHKTKTPEYATLIFVGDIMTDRAVRSRVERQFGGNYDKLLSEVSLLHDADITFGNLEGPVSDKGTNVGSIYSFRMHPQTLSALRGAGFDLLSVANNHAGDWSVPAFADTLARIEREGMYAVGGGTTKDRAVQPIIFTVRGITIGFLAFTDVGPNWLEADETTPGILLASDPKHTTYIKEASAFVDHLVVSYHYGDEYEHGSSERQRELSRGAIDAGARIVVGHHPHVIQEVETYNNGLIFYSLGNFIFDQTFSEETMQGLVARVMVDEKGVVSWTETVTEQDEFLRPTLKNTVKRIFPN